MSARKSQYWVIKVGSSVLGGTGDINQKLIDQLSEQILKLTQIPQNLNNNHKNQTK